MTGMVSQRRQGYAEAKMHKPDKGSVTMSLYQIVAWVQVSVNSQKLRLSEF